MTLEELAISHPYYCSESNWYSNEASENWDTMTSFLDSYENADVDMNLVFRWDVSKDENNKYSAEVFIIQQRKGKFCPQRIKSIKENEIDRFVEFLTKHYQTILSLWKPINLD